MGFKPEQLAVISGLALVISALVVYASNNVDVVEDAIG
jgi:hypothetical protein